MTEFSEGAIVSTIAVIGTLAVISLISVLWYKFAKRGVEKDG